MIPVAIIAGGALLLAWLKNRRSTPPGTWKHYWKGWTRE